MKTENPKGYHAHLYFDAHTIETAKKVGTQAAAQFDIQVGRYHEKPVGPHPMWSCQLAFTPELFGEFIPWLNLNRQGLVVFVHPQTGDDLRDHTDLAMWLGDSVPLKLEMFQKSK